MAGTVPAHVLAGTVQVGEQEAASLDAERVVPLFGVRFWSWSNSASMMRTANPTANSPVPTAKVSWPSNSPRATRARRWAIQATRSSGSVALLAGTLTVAALVAPAWVR